MEVEPLRKLGLTEGEIKVYLALIRLGETTTGPLVDESGISVSKVYSILDRLSKKGLASHIVKRKTKYFKGADPDRLLVYLQEKEAEMQDQESKLKSMISLLKLEHQTAITAETAQVYEGLKGIQTARERTLKIMKKGDEMWIIGIAKTPYEGSMTPYFKEYHKRRYEKGIFCRYLYNEYARVPYGETSATYPLSEVRYMPKGLVTHTWMEIYADTVTIGINKGKSFSVIIQNQEVANSFKIYAQLLWSMAKR
ncbi:MAG: helix-turn-helix domain-containing protein [Candidatus Woesearchaeota archaeon]|nr:helix-turn-helix domain-containing protein [Candidatus Woesearchaeota archaeon]